VLEDGAGGTGGLCQWNKLATERRGHKPVQLRPTPHDVTDSKVSVMSESGLKA
jgi:hypothetical protein